MSVIRNFLVSPFIRNLNAARRVTYIAVMTALSVICNLLLEWKFVSVQFSLTIAVSVVTGVLVGGGTGFVIAFIGDLIGYFGGNFSVIGYTPWIGLSTGLMAFFGGIINIGSKKKAFLFIKIAIVSVLILVFCTICINTTFLYFYLTKGSSVSYAEYVVIRLFVKGQIWNSLFNYALLFITIPLLLELKPFKRFF